ncbi:MAG: hypothetical protein MI807_18400 [Verrucomicrobiales bacterium]|nr:hypothetical protein [Verrucomicrobiales bacterium]
MENGHLPRLDEGAYRGYAIVHWNFSIKDRQTGWLDAEFHFHFREVLLHSLGRQGALCAGYCLMPDHAHLLLLGVDEKCDQREAIRFLRKHTQSDLRRRNCEWQKQPYDNVLREKDRQRFSFEKIAGYIRENPVRAGLVSNWVDWSYTGSMLPGYPEVNFRDADYWDAFWRIYYSKVEGAK